MKRQLVVLITVATVAATLGSLATAAAGWKVFATATDRGEYGTFAHATASVQNPAALGVRATGNSGPFEITWSTFCDGVTRPAAGRAVLIGIPQAAKCTVTASAQGQRSGTAKIELLRR